jgi:hypothetical protein
MGLIDIQSDIQVKCLVIKDKPETLYLQGFNYNNWWSWGAPVSSV